MIAAILTLFKNTDGQYTLGGDDQFKYSSQEDKDFFVKVTKEYKNLIVGRKTYETIPKKLKDRNCFVLTNQRSLAVFEGDQAINTLMSLKEADYCVIGGYSIYKKLFPYCNVIYVTLQEDIILEGESFDFSLIEQRHEIEDHTQVRTTQFRKYIFKNYDTN